MGNKKGYIVTWFLNLEIHYQLHLLENLSSGVGKSLNNQDLMFQSRNVEVSKLPSGSYRYLTHTTG